MCLRIIKVPEIKLETANPTNPINKTILKTNKWRFEVIVYN